MSEIVRVLRVLEYVGPREDVERALRNSSVKGEKVFNGLRVREAVVGTFPELLTSPRKEQDYDPKALEFKEQLNAGNVVDALLLTDFYDWEVLEREVPKWTDEQRVEAYKWAAQEYLSVGERSRCLLLPEPEHVKALRSLPQNRRW
jgi:hypothetical protein